MGIYMKASENRFPGGVWPVMIMPFDREGRIDFEHIPALVDWYIENGARGLFAVCQSGEMYHLTPEERVAAAKAAVKASGGRIPVIASGNISGRPEERAEEVRQMAASGADAVILITNQFADQGESDEVWMDNCRAFLEKIPEEIPLGFYECPYPYKRLISTENLKACAQTGRFYFLKDTCCDLALIRERLQALEGTRLRLYNANTTTLLASVREGAYGFSGVMANFHPQMYTWLCGHAEEEKAEFLQAFLSVASWVEGRYYPVNAKYHMKEFSGIPITTYSRKQDDSGFTENFREEIRMLYLMEKDICRRYALKI